ncbi:MAG TPA: pyroglutamyl-peptidase I [Thermoplasmata archaeon]|nr:pyroglutamyl-peptidase I [Thermoplasmata archaeon]
MPRTILLTGYEPYGREAFNPTGEIARALDGHRIGGARVRGVRIPVAVEPAGPRLRKLLAALKPDGVLSTGVAPGRSTVSVERVALNVLDFRIADNRGRRYRDRPIRKGGPDAYFSTLPVRPILAALRRAGIPAELSNTAGTYLCNFAMYTVLDALAVDGRRVPAGFIHVPQTPEASLDRPGQPSMALPTIRRAIEIALHQIAAARRQRR